MKYQNAEAHQKTDESLPAWGAWIEIFLLYQWGVWVTPSLPAWGAWIEITFKNGAFKYRYVAPRMGGVD